MSIGTNIFDCLLDPSEIFVFYTKIGEILKNDRDIANEQGRGQELYNTLNLLEQTDMIKRCDDGYKKNIICPTSEIFYTTLIAKLKKEYIEEVSTIINCNKHFDEVKSQFFIYVNDIPLKYMGVAMLLEQTGDFKRIKNRMYLLGINSYSEIIKKKPLINIEELQKKLRQDIEHGEQAEKYAWEYEASRLKSLGINKRPMSISDFDVMAGYDMVSYENINSESYDRFIEVKAVSNSGFFWSKNEYETAKLKGNRYFLYLVDLKKVDEPDYVPNIIQDPVINVMKNDNWFVEAQSYHIKPI